MQLDRADRGTLCLKTPQLQGSKSRQQLRRVEGGAQFPDQLRPRPAAPSAASLFKKLDESVLEEYTRSDG